jgi:uncharacterized membrane protein YcjF (UPF0283 family)
LALAAYAGSDIVFGDARWASVLAVVAFVVLIVRPWVAMARMEAAAMVALALALVVQPDLATVFRRGWTDAVALPFLLGAGLM